jgi:hypothetical protein
MIWDTWFSGTLEQRWWWYIWTDSHLIREPLGTSGLKKGAAGAAREYSQWEPNHREGWRGRSQTSQAQPSGRAALRKEQCSILSQDRIVKPAERTVHREFLCNQRPFLGSGLVAFTWSPQWNCSLCYSRLEMSSHYKLMFRTKLINLAINKFIILFMPYENDLIN